MDSDGAPTTLGLTLGFFKHFVDLHGGRDAFQGLTTKDVCVRYVKPFTEASQLSLVEHIHQRGPDEPKYAKPATWFVSHAWRYQFLDVIDALDNFFDENEEDIDAVAVWFCMFNNNQHEISGGTRPFAYWFDKFKDSLTAIGRVVMVLSPWNSPMTLTRTWCVFEVYVAIETNARFEVAMGKAQKAAFLADSAAPNDIFFASLMKINCAKSIAAVPSDRDHIFELIEKGPGFAQVDRLVFQVLEAWVGRMVDKQFHIAATREERVMWRLTHVSPMMEKPKSEGAEPALVDIIAMPKQDEDLGPYHWQAVASLALVRLRRKHPRMEWEPVTLQRKLWNEYMLEPLIYN
ncbi:Aste57867_12074 [Aphanomyces stellatus]|uniref:Aste57867_12074 protein n=1 Tax=Aphanomyces stellatus TaxID=120398 RepID=A0A485KUK2_9STRA|nr:hypothetical protein As57867_012029 [Aphanomyces stellatus]VFT88929.1 Aste57867_12074 [Aphanomyces stellatus]